MQTGHTRTGGLTYVQVGIGGLHKCVGLHKGGAYTPLHKCVGLLIHYMNLWAYIVGGLYITI